MKVKPGDNWLIIGRKGTGKTTFGKVLGNRLMQMYNQNRLYVLDIKLRDFQAWPNIFQQDKAPIRPDQNDRIQVWQPIAIIPDEIEKWLWQIRHDAPAIVMIDELAALNYGRHDTSPEFTTLTKLGRGLPVATIAHTQELVEIPRGALSQPDHIVRFRLKRKYDRNIAAQLMEEEVDEPTDKYGFYHCHADAGSSPQYYKNLQNFFK